MAEGCHSEGVDCVVVLTHYPCTSPLLQGAARALVAHCLDILNTTDNISVIISFFNKEKE